MEPTPSVPHALRTQRPHSSASCLLPLDTVPRSGRSAWSFCKLETSPGRGKGHQSHKRARDTRSFARRNVGTGNEVQDSVCPTLLGEATPLTHSDRPRGHGAGLCVDTCSCASARAQVFMQSFCWTPRPVVRLGAGPWALVTAVRPARCSITTAGGHSPFTPRSLAGPPRWGLLRGSRSLCPL